MKDSRNVTDSFSLCGYSMKARFYEAGIAKRKLTEPGTKFSLNVDEKCKHTGNPSLQV